MSRQWSEFTYNVEADGLLGYIYGGPPNDNIIEGTTNNNHCTYRDYTADKIKLSSETSSVDNTNIGVFKAIDAAPSASQIKADNDLITITTSDGTKLHSECIYDGTRFNNAVNSNPAYIYDADTNGNLLYGGEGANETAEVVIELGEKHKISKIGIGDMFNNVVNGARPGNKFDVYYDKDGEWEYTATLDNSSAKYNSVTMSFGAVSTERIKLVITFNNTVNSVQLPGASEKTNVKALCFSYIGVYDLGRNLAEEVIRNASETVDLGRSVTFNHMTAELPDDMMWQYSTNNLSWSEYVNGTEVTARYIRTSSEDEAITPVVPTFALSWEGNLVSYAINGNNGAVATSGSISGQEQWQKLIDGDLTGSNVGVVADDKKGDITFDFKAPAVMRSLHGYYGAGCWYPQEYTVEMSNRGTIWVENEHERFTLRKNVEGVHSTEGPEHYTPFDHATDLGGVSAAMVGIIGDDLIHPSGMGHTMMGSLFLRQQGAGGDVAVVDIANNSFENCEVTNLDNYGNYITYTYKPNSLPLAVTSDYIEADKYVDITNDLNREIIRADVPSGTYAIEIDGTVIGEYTSEDLSNGVNIAANTKNPNQLAAKDIEAINQERRNTEITVRNPWFYEKNNTMDVYSWVNGVASYNESTGMYEVLPDYKNTDTYKNASDSLKSTIDAYADVRMNPEKYDEQIDSLIGEMYAKAQEAVNTPHEVKIECIDVSTIELPNFFTENMVLQRDKPHTIWGHGTDGDVYTVTISNGENTSTAEAYVADGEWKVDLSPVPVSDKA